MHEYPPSHIWNCDETGCQAGRNGGAKVIARADGKSVHSIVPEMQHLFIVDGHSAHVTLDAVSEASEMGLDMVTLPQGMQEKRVQYYIPPESDEDCEEELGTSQGEAICAVGPSHLEQNAGSINPSITQFLTQR